MPYAENDGVRIHYEVEGEGDPIVLVHGFASNAASWVGLRYVDALKFNYQVIMVDARGHGRSDRPHEVEAYNIEAKVQDIICILNDLDIHRAHYWGYAMGGVLGLGVATFGADRFKSVVIGGAAPGPRDPGRFQALAAMLENGMDGFLQTIPIEKRLSYKYNDAVALRATVLASMGDPVMNLEAPVAPVLVYNGTEDPSCERARLAAQATPESVHYLEIPGQDHAMTFQRSDLVLPQVLPFLSKAARGEIALASPI